MIIGKGRMTILFFTATNTETLTGLLIQRFTSTSKQYWIPNCSTQTQNYMPLLRHTFFQVIVVCIFILHLLFLLIFHIAMGGFTFKIRKTFRWCTLIKFFFFFHISSGEILNNMECLEPFKRQPHKMVKHTQTICQLLPTNCLSMFDYFVGLAFKGIILWDSAFIVKTSKCKQSLVLFRGWFIFTKKFISKYF